MVDRTGRFGSGARVITSESSARFRGGGAATRGTQQIETQVQQRQAQTQAEAETRAKLISEREAELQRLKGLLGSNDNDTQNQASVDIARVSGELYGLRRGSSIAEAQFIGSENVQGERDAQSKIARNRNESIAARTPEGRAFIVENRAEGTADFVTITKGGKVTKVKPFSLIRGTETITSLGTLPDDRVKTSTSRFEPPKETIVSQVLGRVITSGRQAKQSTTATAINRILDPTGLQRTDIVKQGSFNVGVLQSFKGGISFTLGGFTSKVRRDTRNLIFAPKETLAFEKQKIGGIISGVSDIAMNPIVFTSGILDTAIKEPEFSRGVLAGEIIKTFLFSKAIGGLRAEQSILKVQQTGFIGQRAVLKNGVVKTDIQFITKGKGAAKSGIFKAQTIKLGSTKQGELSFTLGSGFQKQGSGVIFPTGKKLIKLKSIVGSELTATKGVPKTKFLFQVGKGSVSSAGAKPIDFGSITFVKPGEKVSSLVGISKLTTGQRGISAGVLFEKAAVKSKFIATPSTLPSTFPPTSFGSTTSAPIVLQKVIPITRLTPAIKTTSIASAQSIVRAALIQTPKTSTTVALTSVPVLASISKAIPKLAPPSLDTKQQQRVVSVTRLTPKISTITRTDTRTATSTISKTAVVPISRVAPAQISTATTISTLTGTTVPPIVRAPPITPIIPLFPFGSKARRQPTKRVAAFSVFIKGQRGFSPVATRLPKGQALRKLSVTLKQSPATVGRLLRVGKTKRKDILFKLPKTIKRKKGRGLTFQEIKL